MEPGNQEVNYEEKYIFLKRKLRLLVFEQECFLSDLRKAQKKLLKVARDKSFLLDRLLQYEKGDASAGDSDVTADSEDDGEATSGKKRRAPAESALYGGFTASAPPGASSRQSPGEPPRKKQKQLKKPSKKSPVSGAGNLASSSQSDSVSPGKVHRKIDLPSVPISREEVERRLDARHSIPEIPAASVQMPSDIFGGADSEAELEEELVIDMAV